MPLRFPIALSVWWASCSFWTETSRNSETTQCREMFQRTPSRNWGLSSTINRHETDQIPPSGRNRYDKTSGMVKSISLRMQSKNRPNLLINSYDVNWAEFLCVKLQDPWGTYQVSTTLYCVNFKNFVVNDQFGLAKRSLPLTRSGQATMRDRPGIFAWYTITM
jgi:hypothetical protein